MIEQMSKAYNWLKEKCTHNLEFNSQQEMEEFISFVDCETYTSINGLSFEEFNYKDDYFWIGVDSVLTMCPKSYSNQEPDEIVKNINEFKVEVEYSKIRLREVFERIDNKLPVWFKNESESDIKRLMYNFDEQKFYSEVDFTFLLNIPVHYFHKFEFYVKD